MLRSLCEKIEETWIQTDVPWSRNSQGKFMEKVREIFLSFLNILQGKGEMETFWLEEGPDDNTSHRKSIGSPKIDN